MRSVKEGHVYIFKIEGQPLYKIGVGETGVNVMARLNSMRVANPNYVYPIEVMKFKNPYEYERATHKALAAYRKSGEWFELTDHSVRHILKQLWTKAEPCDCSSFCKGTYRTQKGIKEYVH